VFRRFSGATKGSGRVFDARTLKWLVINRGLFEWVKVVFMYMPAMEVVLDKNRRGGYSGLRGDILA